MASDQTAQETLRTKGIYLLPNLLTVAGLFAGFYAIIAATKSAYLSAAVAIFIAMILDAMDGRVARLTHSQSDFGAQMDSLSDIVCFGVTPALVLYEWSLASLGKLGWLIAFFYTVCAALRLARFNSQSQQASKRYFRGLSAPAAAGVVASLVWLCAEFHCPSAHYTGWVALMVVLLGLLEVSTIRYRSFKDLDIRGKVPFIVILMVALALVLVSVDPPIILLFAFLIYALSGPLSTLWRLRRMRKRKKNTNEQ